MSVTKLRGKVAAVLNDQFLVINLGTRDGVAEGMKFAVLGAEPIIVLDPDSGEELDELDPEKIRVQVIEVRERVSICGTYRPSIVPMDMAQIFRERLTPHSDDLAKLPEPDVSDSYVRIGDRVVQIAEPYDSTISN